MICLLWKRRQKALGIDDFGKPLINAEETFAGEQRQLVQEQ